MKIKGKLLIFATLILVCISALTSCSISEWFTKNKHEHTFSAEWKIVTNPTKDSDGVKSNVCDECKEKVELPIDKHEHEFSQKWTIVTPPTDTENGEKTNLCDICNLKVYESVAICEVHTFTAEWEIVSPPTTTSLGRKSNVCDVCGSTVTEFIDLLTITGIEIAVPPVKTFYFTNETFNPNGLIVKANFSDGSSAGIRTGWELLTTEKLTEENKLAKIKYKNFILEIPITVSPAIRSTVDAVFTYDDGTLLFVSGHCVGECSTSDGEKAYIIEGGYKTFFVLLKGADYCYKPGDKLEFYATAESDDFGKYLLFSAENENPADTVISSGYVGALTLSDSNSVDGSAAAEELFDSEICRYETVTFSNTFYLVKSGNDYIIHFNSAAADGSGARLPSGKTLHISAKNIDDSLLADRVSDTTLTSYPGVLMSGTLSALYIDGNSDNAYMHILSEKWITADPYIEGEEYLREIAYAFFYQLPFVDYEQYNTRRNINPTPEDATEQQRIYLDCSSYVNAIYYNAFGVNVMPYTIAQKGASTANFMAYARENPEAIDVLGYWECRDYDTKEEREALLSELLKNLRVGDVIVYRKGNAETLEESAGHALIYVGEGKILHCMNTESYLHNGTNPDEAYDRVSSSSVGFETTFNLFESPLATRYLFNYVNFTILRPINRGLTPTEQTISRMTIPSLSIEKLLDKNMYSAVFKDDLLTYTVILRNNSNRDLNGINLVELVPEGTEFVEASEGVTHNLGSISWSGNVKANSTVRITFTVKVTTDEVGAVIESSSGTVNGLSLNKITNTVSAISKEKLDAISSIGKALAEEKTEFDDPILMVKRIYRELLSKDILDYASVTEALNEIIDLEEKAINSECDIFGMVMKNLSGGYLIKASNPQNNERIRAIRIEYMTAGDIIIAEHSTDKDGQVKRQVAFVYLGNYEFLSVSSDVGSCEIIALDKNNYSETNNILISLYSYEKYAFIRPSLTNTAE